jgi:hypothetical protein
MDMALAGPSPIQRVINTTVLMAKFSLGVRVQLDGALGTVTQDRSVLFIVMAPEIMDDDKEGIGQTDVFALTPLYPHLFLSYFSVPLRGTSKTSNMVHRLGFLLLI